MGAQALCPASFWRNVPPLPCVTHPHLGASAASRQKPSRGPFRTAPCTNRSRAVFVNLRYAHRHAAAHRHRYHTAARRRHHHAHHLAPVPPLGRHTAARTPPRPRPCSRAAAWAQPWGCISTTAARAQRPFFFDSGHFYDLRSPSRPATSTLRPAASALRVWLWFWGAAEPALPSGSFRTRAEVRAMASGAPPFRTTPPPTPPRVRVATPPPPIPSSAAAERPDSPRRADTAAHSGPAGGGAGPASAAVMPEADDTAALPRTSRTRARGDAPAYTPRPRYGPRAPTISKAELQRGRRSICTQCKRSQKVSSNIAMCPRDCPCPWAVRPPAQPGWGWEWIPQGDCAFWSRTAERRAHRRMCYVCRCAVTVGDEHPTCPPR